MAAPRDNTSVRDNVGDGGNRCYTCSYVGLVPRHSEPLTCVKWQTCRGLWNPLPSATMVTDVGCRRGNKDTKEQMKRWFGFRDTPAADVASLYGCETGGCRSVNVRGGGVCGTSISSATSSCWRHPRVVITSAGSKGVFAPWLWSS